MEDIDLDLLGGLDNQETKKLEISKQEPVEIESLSNTTNKNQKIVSKNDDNLKKIDISNKPPIINSFATETNKKNMFSLNESGEKGDDSESVFQEQLKTIKQELKDTRNQRDDYKKKYEDSIKFGSKEDQFIASLRDAFENLLFEVTIKGKIKDYAIIIMKILHYEEEEIKRVLEKKKKGT